MHTEQWIVKKAGGEEWGVIKRLIIDSATRQITDADVILTSTGRLVRVPWVSFQVRDDGIFLTVLEGQVKVRVMRASGMGLPETVTLEVSEMANPSV